MLISNIQFATFTASSSQASPNQDSFFVQAYRNKAASGGVFDGVGSEKGSENASNRTNEKISTYLQETCRLAKVTPDEMYKAAFFAHHALKQDDISESTTANYFTTNLEDGETLIGNCGDSRAYLFDGLNLFMLTLDDGKQKKTPQEAEETNQPTSTDTNEDIEAIIRNNSVVKSLEELLPLLKDQIELSDTKVFKRESPDDPSPIALVPDHILSMLNHQNVISRSINANDLPFISITKTEVKPGYKLLLCTDGLSDILTTSDLQDTFRYGLNAIDTKKALLASIANRKSSDIISIPANKVDDLTFIIVEFN